MYNTAPCSKFTSFKGCGNCQVKLSSSEYLLDLEPVAVSNLIEKVYDIVSKEIDSEKDCIQTTKSYVSCKGVVKVCTKVLHDKTADYKNKSIVKNISSKWAIHNSKEVNSAFSTIFACACAYLYNESSNNANKENIEDTIDSLRYIRDMLTEMNFAVDVPCSIKSFECNFSDSGYQGSVDTYRT